MNQISMAQRCESESEKQRASKLNVIWVSMAQRRECKSQEQRASRLCSKHSSIAQRGVNQHREDVRRNQEDTEEKNYVLITDLDCQYKDGYDDGVIKKIWIKIR